MATNLEKGLFVLIGLLVIGGGVYLLNPPEGYETYFCNDTNTVGYCYELVDSPTYGENAWCKWNLDNPRNKKRCLTGWELYKGENVTGTITELPDYEEYSVNPTDKELLAKYGITEVTIPKCQRVSKDYCKVNILGDVFRINIIGKTEEEIDLETRKLGNFPLETKLNNLKTRDKINQEREFYANQTYETEKVMVIK